MSKNINYSKLIKDEFFSISHAQRKLTLSRVTLYKIIETGEISVRAKNKIIAAGYNPLTFKQVLNGKKKTNRDN